MTNEHRAIQLATSLKADIQCWLFRTFEERSWTDLEQARRTGERIKSDAEELAKVIQGVQEEIRIRMDLKEGERAAGCSNSDNCAVKSSAPACC